MVEKSVCLNLIWKDVHSVFYKNASDIFKLAKARRQEVLLRIELARFNCIPDIPESTMIEWIYAMFSQTQFNSSWTREI